jgi:hypothetical protein
VRCGSPIFPRLAQPVSSIDASPKLVTFREAGTQVSPATMSGPSREPLLTLFTTGYKRHTEGECEAFALGFCFWLLLWDLRLFAFGFCLLLLAFGVGSFWKGKELLEENC